MSDTPVFSGSCFCGSVALEVRGQPIAAGICHCESCRRWHSAPINAWALWPAAAITITAGRDQLVEFNKQGSNGPSGRTSCKRCGGAVFNRKLEFGMTVVYAMTLDGSGFVFQPTFHCFYGEGVMQFADGLPKFVDLPTELGGSGQRLDEPPSTGFRRV